MVEVDTPSAVAVRHARCCSATSPRSCTRATRRWPSAGPRPCRSTGPSWPSCWGASELRDLSTRPPWPSWSWSCSASPTIGRSGTPTTSTTRSARSATCRRRRGRARPTAVRDGRTGWPSSSRTRRAIRVRVAGEDRWVAIEDAARFRDALGRAAPGRRAGLVPRARAGPARRPGGRFARTHGPFTRRRAGPRLGLGVAVVETRCRRLEAAGRVVQGEFRPGGAGREWCDAEVLRRLRRRSLAALRKEVEPAPPGGAGPVPAGLARRRAGGPRRAGSTPCTGWSSSSRARRPGLGPGAAGPARPAAGLHARPCSTSCAPRARWSGPGRARSAATTAGWRCPRRRRPRSCCPSPLPVELSPGAEAVRDALADRGALFFRQVVGRRVGRSDDAERPGGAVGAGLGRPGHQRHAGSAPGAASAAPGTRPASRSRARRGPGTPVAGSARRPAPAAGRCCPTASRTPPDAVHAAWPSSSWTATGCSPAGRSWPRSTSRAGSPPSTPC